MALVYQSEPISCTPMSELHTLWYEDLLELLRVGLNQARESILK